MRLDSAGGSPSGALTSVEFGAKGRTHTRQYVSRAPCMITQCTIGHPSLQESAVIIAITRPQHRGPEAEPVV